MSYIKQITINNLCGDNTENYVWELQPEITILLQLLLRHHVVQCLAWSVKQSEQR